jgi:hypothetical protein
MMLRRPGPAATIFLSTIGAILFLAYFVPPINAALSGIAPLMPPPFQGQFAATAGLLGAMLGLTFVVLFHPGQPARLITKSRGRLSPAARTFSIAQSILAPPARVAPPPGRIRGFVKTFMAEVPISRGDLSHALATEPPSRLRTKTNVGGLKARARNLLAAAGANTNVTNMLENIKTYSGLLGQYSASNAALIGWQDPDATLVHSEKNWKRLDRELREDPRKLAVLVPIGGGRKVSEPEIAHLIEKRRKMGWNDARIESEVRSLVARGKYIPTRTFGVGGVYDAKSLRSGPPLPAREQLKVSQLYARAKSFANQVYDVKEAPFSGGRGYSTLRRKEDGSIKGYVQVMRVPGEQIQPLDTLIHEIGHHQLGHTSDLSTKEYKANRGKYEAETQLTSYLVLSHYGVNNKAHSAAYIGQWLRQNDQKGLGEQSIARSMNAAHQIIQGIDAQAKPTENA